MTYAEKLARATLLFHKKGPWSAQDHTDWNTYAGAVLVTIKSLVALADRALKEIQAK